jgi:hypothetical protein
MRRLSRPAALITTPKVGNADLLGATISDRAATFLNLAFSGRHRIKRIAQALSVSPAMAKKLASGCGWTVARLDQATKRWPDFTPFVWPAAEHLDHQLDRVLSEISAVRDDINEIKANLGRP